MCIVRHTLFVANTPGAWVQGATSMRTCQALSSPHQACHGFALSDQVVYGIHGFLFLNLMLALLLGF